MERPKFCISPWVKSAAAAVAGAIAGVLQESLDPDKFNLHHVTFKALGTGFVALLFYIARSPIQPHPPDPFPAEPPKCDEKPFLLEKPKTLGDK